MLYVKTESRCKGTAGLLHIKTDRWCNGIADMLHVNKDSGWGTAG